MKIKKRAVLIYHRVRLFMAEMNKDQVSAFAAQSAFFLLLSLFPLAMTLLTFVKYLPFTETQVIAIVRDLFPKEINSNFEFMFAEIFNSKSSIIATTASILLTVWSASKGTMAIGRGLTFMAGKEDSVNYFLRRAIHALYTLIFCVMIVAVLVIYILGDVVVSKILVRLDSVEGFQLVDTVANILSIIKIAFAPTVLFGVMLVAYWALPVGKVRIKTAMPGAAFTTILWMVLSFGVSSYINLVGINTYMYGSLASVILLALWLYMCMYVMLIGAEINKFMDNGIRGIRRRAHKAGRKKRRRERKKRREEKRRMRRIRKDTERHYDQTSDAGKSCDDPEAFMMNEPQTNTQYKNDPQTDSDLHDENYEEPAEDKKDVD